MKFVWTFLIDFCLTRRLLWGKTVNKSTADIILLSRKNSLYGGMILREAQSQGLQVDAVVVHAVKWRQKYLRLKGYARKVGWMNLAATMLITAIDARFMASPSAKAHITVEAEAQKQNLPLYSIETLNSSATVRLIKELKPDYLLLGGVGIIKSDLIKSPQKAVINAHPGIVPFYRGNYVVRWAILNGDAVGITVHIVDAGVDTGPVLNIQKFIPPLTRSLIEIETFFEQKRAKQIITHLLRLKRSECNPETQVEQRDLPQYSYMPLAELLKVYRKLYKEGYGE